MDLNDVDGKERPGRMVQHFQLMEQIGTGSFGTVWKAKDTKLNRMVAIKIPRSDKATTGANSDAFLHEARAVAKVNHPGIVKVHDVAKIGTVSCIVSEYVDGKPLAKWIKEKQPNERELTALFIKIAEALHAAHQNDVVHRDLKPGNVLIDSKGDPHILDFGLAKTEFKDEDTNESNRRIMGTPNYMSPEQASGQQQMVDCRTDVYSLGVLLYEMLTGERPFRGKNIRGLIQQIQREAPTPLRQLDGRIPRDLETITLKCLEKSRRRRYQTAAEFAEDLKRYLNRQPILARPTTKLETAYSWVNRNRTLAAALAGIAVITTIAFAVVTWQWQSALAQNAALKIQTDRANLAEAKAVAALKKQEELAFAAQQQSYATRVYMAHRELSENNIRRVDSLLDECDARLRQWEWNYLKRSAHQDVASWDAHDQPIIGLASVGNSIVSVSQSGKICFWDAITKAKQSELSVPGRAPTSAEVSKDSKLLALAAGTEVHMLDLNARKLITTIDKHRDLVTDLAFSPDGAQLASCSADGSVRLFDARNGNELKSAVLTEASDEKMRAIAWSSTGDLACGSSVGRVQLLTKELTSKQKWMAKEEIRRLCFGQSGERLFAGDAKGAITIWNTQTNREVASVSGHSDVINEMYVDAKDTLFSASDDRTVRAWDQDGNAKETWRGSDTPVTSLCVLSGKKLLAGSSHKVFEFNCASEERSSLQKRFDQDVAESLLSPDGKRIAVLLEGDSTIQLYDFPSGHTAQTIDAGGRVSKLLFVNPTQLITCNEAGDASLFDVVNGQRVASLLTANSKIVSAALNSKRDRLAVCCADQSIHVVELATKAAQRHQVDCMVNDLAFTSDDTIELAVNASKLKRFQITAKVINDSADTGLPRVKQLLVSEQALLARDDRTISVLSLPNLAMVKKLSGHRGELTAMALNPSIKRLISVGSDGKVVLWNSEIWEEVLSLAPTGQRITAVSAVSDIINIGSNRQVVPLDGSAIKN